MLRLPKIAARMLNGTPKKVSMHCDCRLSHTELSRRTFSSVTMFLCQAGVPQSVGIQGNTHYDRTLILLAQFLWILQILILVLVLLLHFNLKNCRRVGDPPLELLPLKSCYREVSSEFLAYRLHLKCVK